MFTTGTLILSYSGWSSDRKEADSWEILGYIFVKISGLIVGAKGGVTSTFTHRASG